MRRINVAAAALPFVVWGCQVQPAPKYIQQRHATAFEPRAEAQATQTEERPTESELLKTADLGLYLRYALFESAALRRAYETWRAELERVPQVTTLPDPVFSFSEFVETIETRTGPQERRFSLSQTLPWFGKLSGRGDAASARAEAAWGRVLQERLAVERDVAVSFYDYAYLGESVRITREVLELLQQLEPVVRQRIASASATQEDLLRLQVEIGRVENDLASLLSVRPSLSARLASVLNLKMRETLPLPALVEPEEFERISAAELVGRAAERNPELLSLSESVRERQEQRELASLQRWPDVTVGVDYIDTGDAISPIPDSGNDPVALRLSMNLPIWTEKYSAAEREADRRTAAASHALADRKASLRADVEHAAFEFEDAGRQLRLYRESLLPRAREALEVTRSSYRAGNASLLDVIDSERVLLDFETAFWRAVRDHYQSEARLQALIGEEL